MKRRKGRRKFGWLDDEILIMIMIIMTMMMIGNEAKKDYQTKKYGKSFKWLRFHWDSIWR